VKKFLLLILAATAVNMVNAEEVQNTDQKNSWDREIHGKVEAGYVLVKIDTMNDSDKVDSANANGIRFNGTFVDQTGLTLKASLINATENGPFFSKRDMYRTASVGVGFYLPVHTKLSFIPTISYGISKIQVDNTYYIPNTTTVYKRGDVRSDSDMIGLGTDIILNINECFSVTAQYQYSWSHSSGYFNGDFQGKSSTSGSNYSISGDYNLNEKYTASLAFALGKSLCNEKNGFRVSGGMLSLARRF